MRIIQITDIHVGHVDEFPFGVDLRANFRNVLQEVIKQEPDLIVITGDICLDQGDETVYSWVRDQIKVLGVRCEIVLGNHDDTSRFATVFNIQLEHDGQYYYKLTIGGKSCFFLDSSVGELSLVQLDWLKSELTVISDKEVIIFMHHPILHAGVPHMDRRYALKNKEQIISILNDFNKQFYVFVGHFHCERSIHSGNVHLFISPSTYIQVDANSDHFAIQDYRPGYRIIDVDTRGIRTQVKYIDPSRFMGEHTH